MGRTSDARARIIESAAQMFHSRSAGDVGIQDVCEQAGVKKGSFYHFFNSKQDLILATLEAHWQMGQQQVFEQAFRKEYPPLVRIRRFTELLCQWAQQDQKTCGFYKGCAMGNLAAEMSTQDEVVRRKVAQVFDQATRYFKEALDDAVALGQLPPLDTQVVAQALWAYMEGVFLIAKAKQDPAHMKKLFETALGFLESFAPSDKRGRKRKA